MIRLLITCSLFLFFITTISAQAPGIKWQKCLGGTYGDFSKKVIASRFGGYILAGNTYSNDGDVVGVHGTHYDGWVVKTNDTGKIIWQKCLGGTDMDLMQSCVELENGDIAVILTSYSKDGDVTDHIGDSDAWVVLLDRNGNIKWKKSYGTTLREEGRDIKPTLDNNFIFTAAKIDASNILHIWIVKINASGDILWEKDIAGNSADNPYSLIVTSDNGFLLLGDTWSNQGDLFWGNHGNQDIFIFKFDSDGNIQWGKLYGGSLNEKAGFYTQDQCTITACKDGGYIFCGYTYSNDGEVSGNHDPFTFVTFNAWIVKTDANGSIQWQKCLGGSWDDYLYDVKETPDGEFVTCGTTHSSDGDLTGIIQHNLTEAWVIKLSKTGSIIWQKAIGGTNGEEFYSVQPITDEKITLVANTYSNDEDVSGNHSPNGTDLWLVHLAPINTVKGYAYLMPIAMVRRIVQKYFLTMF